MKHTHVIAFALLGFCTAAFGAKPASVQFVGSLQQDNAAPVTFDIQIPSGQTATLKLGDGHALAFATAGSLGNPDRTTVVLTDASGKLLHSQTIPGTARF